ncbi:MAG TPA: helicase [Treponema sp.]|nr:helicase [Treponema sp.]
MEKTITRFTPEIRTSIADTIKASGGNEVFFTGRIDRNGVVTEVRVCARGNDSAVPVVQSAAQEADVLIHNHPSGDLTPSNADLSVAARMADYGTGFYIINNTASEVYAVVEPIPRREKIPIDEAAIAALLDELGPFAAKSPTYETRPTQIALAASIARSFNIGAIGVFEAGTGVGKSYAYLLPVIEWALTNQERVVVSTGTINLQQQLMEKDIPAASGILGKKVKAVLMKGRQNYVCLRRLAEALEEKDFFDEDLEELEQIFLWAQTTQDGSKSDLPFLPRDSIWSRIASESDACMGMRCSRRDDCFVMRVRKDAADASILIVNHHLLFADLETRMMGAGYEGTAVLPPFHHIVFDEAHAIEAAATSFFSEYFTRFKLNKQLGVFFRSRRNFIGGHLPALERISAHGGEISAARAAIETVKSVFFSLEDAALSLVNGGFSWRLSDATVQDAAPLLEEMESLRQAIAIFTGIIRNVLDGIDEDDQDEQVVWESKFALRRLEFIGTLCLYFQEWSERRDSVFWIEKNKLSWKGSGETVWYPRFVQTPLSIAPMMCAGVFEPFSTVVCTSATLRIAKKFEFWMRRTGVSRIEEDRILSGEFGSPFPYSTNVLLAIPDSGPLPDSPDFQPWVETTITSLLQASGGHALVLFTSYEMLRGACETARRALSPLGITILRQGDDDRSRLLETFKQDETSVLFATDSFWEGVDAPGDALLQVIIVKLPFRVPNNPVLQARSEAITQRGGNAFMELSLPEAALRFRQGFGRLMRRKTDRGVVTVLDRRIVAKRYGKVFLESLPETLTCFAPLSDVLHRVEHFLYP